MSAVIEKAAAIVTRERKLLMARSRGRQVLFLPGGKREPGENWVQCLARELDEELGCGLATAPRELVRVEAPAHGGGQLRMVCFEVELDAEPRPCAEVDAL